MMWLAIGALVLLVLAALVYGIVLLVRWRRRRREQKAAANVTATPSLVANLERTWQAFYRSIPRQARHYPTVVVLGDSGTGKSHLIDNCVDWRGQQNEFMPSLTKDSRVQLYLGQGVVVQELSSSLLRDFSRDTRRALGKMWRRVSRESVVALVTVDAHALCTAPSESLRPLAQLIRGKLRVLARRRRVSLRLCLTHLDRLEGYREFINSLGESRSDMWLPIRREGQLIVASEYLTQFEDHLNNALANTSPESFRMAVRFHESAPLLFGAMAPLLRMIEGEDPLGASYEIEGVYLSGAERSDRLGNPFAVDSRQVVSNIQRTRSSHYARSFALVGAAALAAAFLHLNHGSHVGAAESAVDQLALVAEEQPAVDSPRLAEIHDQATATIGEMHDAEILWLPLSYNPRKDAMREHFLGAIRTAYLLPKAAEATEERIQLYLTALLYSTHDSALGELISAAAPRWAAALEVPERAVRDYVAFSEVPWPGDVISLMPEAAAREDDETAWQSYLSRLSRAAQHDTLSRAALTSLHSDLPPLSDVDEYELLAEAARLLRTSPGVIEDARTLFGPRPASGWVRDNHASLSAVSELIKSTALSTSDVGGWSLVTLLSSLRDPSEQSAIAGPQPGQINTYEWQFAGQTVHFEIAA
ncbi:MAG: hypothetical protein AAGC55_02235, partial [Myxococcota bacterium]